MSPTIPPVLVLSFLLLPPLAKTEEMMDPLALIRQTLKYWRRIYEMYHEEVALGYCWTEYFLRSENGTNNVQTLRSSVPDWSNFELMEDQLPTETREDWLHSSDSRREHARRKRSYEILNSADGDVDEISSTENGAITNHAGKHSAQRSPTSKMSSENGCNPESINRRKREFRRNESAHVSVFEDNRELSSIFTRLFNAFKNYLELMDQSIDERNGFFYPLPYLFNGTTSNNRMLSVQKTGNLKIYPKTSKKKHVLRNANDQVLSLESFLPPLSNATREEISTIFKKGVRRYDEKEVFNQKSQTGVESESINRHKHTLRQRKKKSRQFSDAEKHKRSFHPLPSLLNKTKIISIQKTGSFEIYPKTRTWHDLISIDWQKLMFGRNVSNQVTDFEDVKKLSSLLSSKEDISTIYKMEVETHDQGEVSIRKSETGNKVQSINRQKHVFRRRRRGNNFSGVEELKGFVHSLPYLLNGSLSKIFKISTNSTGNGNRRLSIQKSASSRIHTKTSRTWHDLKLMDQNEQVLRRNTSYKDVKKLFTLFPSSLNASGDKISTIYEKRVGRHVSVEKSGTPDKLESTNQGKHMLCDQRNRHFSFYSLPSLLNRIRLKNGNRIFSIQELENLKVYLNYFKTKYGLKLPSWYKQAFRTGFEGVKKLSSLLSSRGDISTIYKKQMEERDQEKVSVQKPEDGGELQSINHRKHMHHRRKEKRRQFSGFFCVNGPSSLLPSLPNEFRSRKNSKKNDNEELSIQRSASLEIYPKTMRTWHDLISIDSHKRAFRRFSDLSNDNNVAGLSSPPSSLNIFILNGSSTLSKGGKILEILLDSELKGNRAESDQELGGNSKGLEVNARRKILSVSRSQNLLDDRLLSLHSQFKDDGTIKNFDDITKNPRCKKKLNSKLQKAEQRPIKRNYQRIRPKRDTNNQIENLLQPLTKTKLPSTAVTSFNNTGRFLASSVYTTPKSTARRTFRSKNNGRRTWKVENNTGHASEAEIVDPVYEPLAKSPSFYSKYYENISRRSTHRSSIFIDTQVLPVTFKNLYNVLLPLISNHWTFRPLQNYMYLKISIENLKQDNSKQLLTMNDNDYQKTELHFPLKKSDPEETGRKEPTRDPLGRPSLLPVSYQRFMGDYRNPTSGTSRNSRPSRSSEAKDQGRRSSNNVVEARGLGRATATLFNLHTAFMVFLRNLGFFVQVGRQIIDYVESNAALACTKDYLWGKAVQWIDS